MAVASSEDVTFQLDLNEYSAKGDNSFNPIALRKAKIVYNFGLTECQRVKH